VWITDIVNCLEESTLAHPRIEEALAFNQQHLPKRIYKYRRDCSNHRNNLKTGTVRLSSPESFNDPYDCWLTLPDGLLETLLEKRLLDELVKAYKLQNVIPVEQIENAKKSHEPLKTILAHIPEFSSSATGGNPKKMAELWSTQVKGLASDAVSKLQDFRKMTKLCSFSAVNDSMLMWGHYSDNHRGFCLEYDLEVLNADHPFRKNLYPVVYSSQLYDLTPYAEKLAAPDHQEFSTMLPLLAMLHKFDGWKYEEEWRTVFEKEVVMDDHDRPAPPVNG
jgi:hypothetical protein